MKQIILPDSYNYCSAFLTFACTFKCDYCINRYNGLHKYESMSAADWIKGINRIKTKKDLPVTITGGEPTLHTGFYQLIRGVDKAINIDLLTNGEFDHNQFMWIIPPDRMKRDAKYASIRFSFHPGYTKAINLVCKVYLMKEQGYSVGIWGVDKGRDEQLNFVANQSRIFGLDFRVKEFLDSEHGNYKYPEAVDGKRKKATCKPSELLIAPDGGLYRCHHDLYHGVHSYGHILDEEVSLPKDFSACDNYGLCNPCDIKAKFDRFQKLGHCSVTIKENNETRG